MLRKGAALPSAAHFLFLKGTLYMREFWSENSRTITKLLLNQFGAAFMGLMITAAATSNEWLRLFASCFATAFYLILLYNVIWERGGQDKIRVDGGRAAYRPATGLLVSLVANIPNLLLGILVIIGSIFGAKDGPFAMEWAGNLYAVSNVLARLWNAMYIGIIQTYSPYNPIIHLLDVIPALVVTGGGYLLGLKNIRLLGVFELKRPESEGKDKKSAKIERGEKK